MPSPRPLVLVVRRRNEKVAELTAEADPADTRELYRLLVDAVRRDGKPEERIGEYEMEVRNAADPTKKLTTFVATARGGRR